MMAAPSWAGGVPYDGARSQVWWAEDGIEEDGVGRDGSECA
jgi:hypothetical protein